MGKIIWLASYPKSGNTWMRAFIHNLLRNPDQSYDINKLGEFSYSDSTNAWYERVIGKPWNEWSADEVSIARWGVQRDMTKSRPDNVFVKTHNALVEYLGRPMIHSEWTAGIIYILRNPLDVVISLADHYGMSIDDTIILMGQPTTGSIANDRIVYEVHNTWSAHVESWTRHAGPWLRIVRYEDLLASPVRTFGGIAKFLGLNPPRARLDHAIEASSFKTLRKQEEEIGFRERSDKAEKFFRVGKAGQWQTTLTPKQIAAIVADHGVLMKRFGYLPEGAVVDSPAGAASAPAPGAAPAAELNAAGGYGRRLPDPQ